MRRRLLPAVLLLCLFLTAFIPPASAEEAAGPARLVLDQTELTLVKGRTQKLKTTLENVENPKKVKFTWESSDTAVATIDRDGTVKAKDGGTAQILCMAELTDGSTLTAAAAVTVTVPVSEVKITTKGNTQVPFGESIQLEYTVKPENATNRQIEWTSSNEAILRVDESGRVTAAAAGKANITGKSENGKTARISLYVPTLHPSADMFTVTSADTVFHFTYCGNDFDRNVQIQAKGGCFEYSLIRNDPDIGVALTALSVGEGTLTVTDKKDNAAKFTVNITVSEEAFPAGRRLLIREAAYEPESGILTVRVSNTGSTTVTGTEIRINPLDQDGKPVLIGEGWLEEILLEDRVLHSSAVIEPEKETTIRLGCGAEYRAAEEVEIAFDRIERTEFDPDGNPVEKSVTELPDDRLCWYSVRQNAYTEEPENPIPYSTPGDEVFEQAKKVHLGITVIPVPAELADAYGFACGGLMITAVEEESPAERIGLKVRDLIFSVNDTDYESEPYMMTRAASDLADGKQVTLLLQRDNEFWELTLKPGDAKQ